MISANRSRWMLFVDLCRIFIVHIHIPPVPIFFCKIHQGKTEKTKISWPFCSFKKENGDILRIHSNLSSSLLSLFIATILPLFVSTHHMLTFVSKVISKWKQKTNSFLIFPTFHHISWPFSVMISKQNRCSDRTRYTNGDTMFEIKT